MASKEVQLEGHMPQPLLVPMKESIEETAADDEDDDIDSQQDEELTFRDMKEALHTIETIEPTTTATTPTDVGAKGEHEGNGPIIQSYPSSKPPDELLCQLDRTTVPDASSSLAEENHAMPSLVAWSNNSSHSIRSTSSELSMPSLVSWADGSFRNSTTTSSVGTSLGGSSVVTSGGGGGGGDISVVSAVSTAAVSIRTFSDGESLDTIGPLLNDARPALPLKKLKPDVIRIQKEGRWQSGGDDDKKEATVTCLRTSDTKPLPPAAPKR